MQLGNINVDGVFFFFFSPFRNLFLVPFAFAQELFSMLADIFLISQSVRFWFLCGVFHGG